MEKKNYKEKFCDICEKTYKDYYQHKKVKHSDKEKSFELCIDCGKRFQKNYMKKHNCSEVLVKARENWGIFCNECDSFHMKFCTRKENYELE